MSKKLLYITADIVRGFFESKNTGLSKMVHGIQSIDIFVHPDYIEADVYYDGYGKCTFRCMDFEIYKIEGVRPGFTDEDFQEFVVLKLLESGEMVGGDRSKAEYYVDHLLLEENSRHATRQSEIDRMYEMVRADASVDDAGVGGTV